MTIDLNINAVSLSGLVTIGPIVTGGDVVLGVEFYVDGVRLDTDFIPPYSLVINTASYADGPHTITVYTADNTGQAANDGLFRPHRLNVGNRPPHPTQHLDVFLGLAASNHLPLGIKAGVEGHGCDSMDGSCSVMAADPTHHK